MRERGGRVDNLRHLVQAQLQVRRERRSGGPLLMGRRTKDGHKHAGTGKKSVWANAQTSP